MPKTSTKTVAPHEEIAEKGDPVLSALQDIAQGMGRLSDDLALVSRRVTEIETGGANKFKEEARAEDIAVASESRKGVDPKINQIVDEMLGADFGAEIKPLGDRPGYRFTVLVPQRLSDVGMDSKPVQKVDEHGNILAGQYEKDQFGNTKTELYFPGDRRSRIMSSSDSYDAIKAHCEKVRGYIVASFARNSKPLPEFKVK